jgi:hypothetical protein
VTGFPGADGGVGGVLREFDDHPVAVAAEGVILLGVGVLAEPGGGGGPRVQHGAAEGLGVEGISHGHSQHSIASKN